MVTDEQCVTSHRWHCHSAATASATDCSDCIGSSMQLLASVMDEQCVASSR